jgi:hypothetical protein
MQASYGIPAIAGIEERELAAIIGSATPTKNHAGLRRALAARWPDVAWRVAAPKDEFSTDGGIVDRDLARVANAASAWIQQRIDEAGGDYLSVWRQYKGDDSLLRTEFRGETVWAAAPLGAGVADYVQVALDHFQESDIGPLIGDAPWQKPSSADDLRNGLSRYSGDPRPVGEPQYRFRRAVHAESFLAEMAAVEQRRRSEFAVANVLHEQTESGDHRPGTVVVTSSYRVRRGTALPRGYREVEITDRDPEYLTRKTALQRFYADWSASSAGRLGNRIFNHWAVSFMDYDDGHGRQLHGVPRWLTNKAVPEVGLKSGQTVFALMDRLLRFDERVGYGFGWYFFMLHGNRVSSSVGEQLAEAAEDGVIALPSWDREVLLRWKSAPYGF